MRWQQTPAPVAVGTSPPQAPLPESADIASRCCCTKPLPRDPPCPRSRHVAFQSHLKSAHWDLADLQEVLHNLSTEHAVHSPHSWLVHLYFAFVFPHLPQILLQPWRQLSGLWRQYLHSGVATKIQPRFRSTTTV